MSYPWIEEKIFWSTKGFHQGKGGQINRIRVHIVRDRAGGRLPSVAPKIHFNLVSGGAHPPTSAVGTLRTGKLKELKSSERWRMVDGQDSSPSKGTRSGTGELKGRVWCSTEHIKSVAGFTPRLVGNIWVESTPISSKEYQQRFFGLDLSWVYKYGLAACVHLN